MLLGQKITTTEKILNYIKDVNHIIQSKLGNNKAIAYRFLRKIENGKFSLRPHKNQKCNYELQRC